MFKSYHPSLPPANTGRVLDAKQRFEQKTGRKPILENIMQKIEGLEPDHAHLFEKEKPIIAELITKLKNREDREDNSNSDYTLPSMMSSMSSSSSMDDFEPQHSASKSDLGVTARSDAVKSSLEKLLATDDETKEKFREFIGAKGAIENLNFWEACFECERKAHGYASLAKKIINQLMKEIKETHGHPEKSHMDLALSSAVTAVRYELLMHKEETKETARDIVNEYVRDQSPQRVNLTTEKRNALINAVDHLENFSEHDIVKIMMQAQIEIKDLMERKFFDQFASTHRT